jgi:hypothetical protein
LLVNREVILGLCERRGLDVETIEVYLDSNKTPLPLLTSDTSWLSGRTLRIRGKRLSVYTILDNVMWTTTDLFI